VFLGGGVPLVGPQEELRGPSGYTPRGFTFNPETEAKYGFSVFIPTKKKRKEGKKEKLERVLYVIGRLAVWLL